MAKKLASKAKAPKASKSVTPKLVGLASVRARIDALDAKLLKLIDERAAMARDVIAAKGEDRGLPIRTDRESAVIRGLLAQQHRTGAVQPNTACNQLGALLGNLCLEFAALAIILGGGLIRAALLLLRQKTGAAARTAYKFSTAYLAFLFMAMILDRLILKFLL